MRFTLGRSGSDFLSEKNFEGKAEEDAITLLKET